MYSAVDSIPTYSGINATLPAQAPSSGHQPISDIIRSDGYASNHLLGKRCIALHHDSDNASFSKKQKLAMYINTRHMAVHYPGVSHHQHDTLSNLINPSFSSQEPLSQPSIGRKQSNSPSETSSIEDAAVFASKNMDVSSKSAIENTPTGKTMEANVQAFDASAFGQNNLTIPFNTTSLLFNNKDPNKVKSIIPTRQNKQNKPHAFFSNHNVNAAASNSHTIVNHTSMAIRNAAQTRFLKSIQRWIDAIKCVCDVHKQQLYYELFGDEPTITANVPDLLKLLQDIDQNKNQITWEEEHATGLIKAIQKVLSTCDDSTEKESIRLASNILDNLVQRFMGVRFLE
ncbi:hypothetical protein J3R82DRAFT_4511 [Butyriboletus roseoflavus]|nr:hypothetical protein J3R82DRAFT_4511 [Butyriboletus roseoflavus]